AGRQETANVVEIAALLDRHHAIRLLGDDPVDVPGRLDAGGRQAAQLAGVLTVLRLGMDIDADELELRAADKLPQAADAGPACGPLRDAVDSVGVRPPQCCCAHDISPCRNIVVAVKSVSPGPSRALCGKFQFISAVLDGPRLIRPSD